jgi:abortive infection bacteriophage resistance protein
MSKPAYSISDQVNLLKGRGMIFNDELLALERLRTVNYFHLKPYWLSELDPFSHVFRGDICFERIMECYEFDRSLRFILFPAIERIEITVRSKLINYLSLAYGSLWYMDPPLFETSPKLKDGVTQTTHLHTLSRLRREFARSKEVVLQNYSLGHLGQPPES